LDVSGFPQTFAKNDWFGSAFLDVTGFDEGLAAVLVNVS